MGLVGGLSTARAAGDIRQAGSDSAQVVRTERIYAGLLRADVSATDSFLVGGVESPQARAVFENSLTDVSTNLALAAAAQPADRLAFGRLNDVVTDYAQLVEHGRAMERAGLPVGPSTSATPPRCCEMTRYRCLPRSRRRTVPGPGQTWPGPRRSGCCSV